MNTPAPIKAQSCADAPVLKERGQREVFCGLRGLCNQRGAVPL